MAFCTKQYSFSLKIINKIEGMFARNLNLLPTESI